MCVVSSVGCQSPRLRSRSPVRISAPVAHRLSLGSVGRARRGRDGGLFAVSTLAWEVEADGVDFDCFSASIESRSCADRALRRRGAAVAEPPRLHGQCLRPHLGIIASAPGAEGPLSRSLLVSTVNVFDHISASSRIRPAPRGRYRGGLVIGGCGCVGGPTLSCERELACSCFASPQYTIPVLPSSPSALSTSGGPLLFVTCWPKWSAGPLRVQVVAVGVSSASSARNPCRPASCLHADLHSTYSRTAVHYRQQLYELRLSPKTWLADAPGDQDS